VRRAAFFAAVAVGLQTSTVPAQGGLSDLTTLLSETATARMASDGVAGAVVVVLQDGTPVWTRAFGYADRAAQRPMTEDAMFRVESLSKPVTAWGALVLAESGKLDLDAPVTGCLQGWLLVGPLAPQVDTSARGEMEPALLPAFETSFLDQTGFGFRYCDSKGAETERQVEPQAMLNLPPLRYLVACDPVRADFRHFRKDRISRPEVVNGTAFRSRHLHFDSGVQRIRYA
jgi:hypothetical protein